MKPFVVIALCYGVAFAQTVTISENGKSNHVIIIPDQPQTVLKTAAKELADHLKLVTGAQLPVIEAAKRPADKPAFVLAPIDGKPERLQKYVDDYCGGDGMEMARRYFALLQDYVVSWKPPIIAHFDLIRKNNAVLRLYDEESAEYRMMALDALRPMADAGALLEVNTGAIARGYLTTPYPAPFLLKAWKEWGGEVIVNSDCHDMRYLDIHFDESEALLRSLGYDHAVRLGKTALWERYSL